MDKKIFKDKEEVMILGVAAGLADYFQIDVSLIRLGLVVLIPITTGFIIPIYIVAGVIFPDKSELRGTASGK